MRGEFQKLKKNIAEPVIHFENDELHFNLYLGSQKKCYENQITPETKDFHKK